MLTLLLKPSDQTDRGSDWLELAPEPAWWLWVDGQQWLHCAVAETLRLDELERLLDGLGRFEQVHDLNLHVDEAWQ